MEASTTIRKMLAGNRLFVPAYQRAYSWETDKQVSVFLSDLEDYIKSQTKSPYYFGHFLFEEKTDDRFGVIDGQQRLTTIVIFLSALFRCLKSLRPLSENEHEIFEDIIKRGSTYHFETVDYDKQIFKDYVIDQSKGSGGDLETESAKRIVAAFDFFTHQLAKKEENYLLNLLNAVQNSSCTTHPVKNESEAIQMFIFQNNRGKDPSHLEIIKAKFMFNVHLYGGEEKDSLIEEIKNRFEKIYKSISDIKYNISEDDVLTYTLRVYFNSLRESNAIERIDKLLSEENPIPFIKAFTQSLATSFEHLTTFFGKDEQKNIEIHSLITLGGFAIAIPFIIKAYTFGLPTSEICKLCLSLESLVLRHRLIGTRADLTSRINSWYQDFTEDNKNIVPIIENIKWMITEPNENWWWAHWNNSALENALQGSIHHPIAKFLLWKYENYLERDGKNGYSVSRFDKINCPELEHIAPQTPTDGEPVAAGYCEYDEEFVNQYINCLGNYLLLSKSHNCSVGNKPFIEKYDSYKHLAQQREVQELAKESKTWTKELIQTRKEKIIGFIIANI
ncbi:hypothetical protein AGMMS4957_11530 [Bacteroidia bacterium]|nr:hypothetical protein AGMMS4957_11530 [Bacteroidia bacterium]